ncbi:hypothetical protein ACEWY4_007638 [Coilia grayii]|uniref:Integrase catalytic domain-containing protein n=1 Tax=Coilia grayii TaxID=363190 RepID=A0ABD1KHG2_9TELE
MMDIFYTHGSPEVILTDRGREFWNRVKYYTEINTLHKICGIKHRMTSAYHPQTNGLDERTNQTLKIALGKTLEGYQERWEDNLKEVLFAHNSSFQASSRFSPFRLMYGREPRLFSEIASDVPVGEVAAVEEEDIEAFVSERAEADAVVFDQVRENVEKAQERQKAAYRRKKKGTKRFIATPGMVVLKKNERKRGRPGMTMLPEWPTKYRVISVEDNLVQLQSMDGRLLSTKTPYASVKPLRQRYQTGFSTDRAVGMASADSSEFVEDTLQVTCIGTSTASDSTSSKTEQGTLEDGDIVITDVQSGRPLPAALSGRVDEFSVMLLSPHTWLDDHVIQGCSLIFGSVCNRWTEGLHATTSLALLSTLPAATQGFVQIFNVCANHWVTVSNIGCQVGVVNVFDSLNASHTQEFLMQVTGLLCFPGRSVKLQWPSIQQQEGGSDCGLFAIANSLTLCRGEDPCNVSYNQTLMRTHLYACFQNGLLTPFPKSVKSLSL